MRMIMTFSVDDILTQTRKHWWVVMPDGVLLFIPTWRARVVDDDLVLQFVAGEELTGIAASGEFKCDACYIADDYPSAALLV